MLSPVCFRTDDTSHFITCISVKLVTSQQYGEVNRNMQNKEKHKIVFLAGYYREGIIIPTNVLLPSILLHPHSRILIPKTQNGNTPLCHHYGKVRVVLQFLE